MITDNKIGRLAGFLYLVVVVTGIFSLVYVPSQITDRNDPHATVKNIIASESLFRLGIASFMIEQVAFLLLPLMLFRLFRNVDKTASVIMVALSVVSVPIALSSLSHKLDALSLLTDLTFARVFTQDQLPAAAILALGSYHNELLITNLFWGLWLLPFGYLVLKSRFLPKFLGVFLVLGCAGYLIDIFGELLVPRYSSTFISSYASLPGAVGEIGTCLWLLLVGPRVPKSTQA